MLYPLTFHPIFKERIWGGRNLERLYHKALPPGVPIGESWEICDRPGDASVIANGPLAGKDLRWLMEHHERDLLGHVPSQGGRFPWLMKILDAEEKLSLQVHPPEHQAAALAGEPKTEMWYITRAAPGAELYVGLQRGITREEFERRIQNGSVAGCFHRVPVRAGDAMFLPSGRVHAIGAGLVIFEIQQNSDTTYRVYDWDRAGMDGKPRALHIPQSLASIDFGDFEPALIAGAFSGAGASRMRPLARHRLFKVNAIQAQARDSVTLSPAGPRIVGVLENRVRVTSAGAAAVELTAGQFCLLPASAKSVELSVEPGTSYLLVEPGE